MTDISEYFKSDPHDQTAFLSFCEQQGDKEYTYIFGESCAYAQFLRSISHNPDAVSVTSSEIRIDIGDEIVTSDDIEYNLQEDLVHHPQTFNALAERIRERHDREYAISAESMHWIP